MTEHNTKIDIFSGFLGAGKTTLIRKLIAEAYAGEKLVLIENEFGEIAIDGGFLQDAGVEITEMNSGCICCSLVGDFRKALQQVLEQFTPDRILIEPSGVGKLSDVMKAVSQVVNDHVVINAAITVIDAKRAKMYMHNFGEFYSDQIEAAGTIVLSRSADISQEKLTACLNLLREHNKTAEIVSTDWDQLNGKQILAAMEHTDTLEAQLEELCKEHHHHEHDEHCDCGCHDHEHHHEHEHEHEHHHEHGENCSCGHDHHHADEVFTSWGSETARVYTKEELESILAALDQGQKYGLVLRAKGIVAGTEGWLHFDHVPGEQEIRCGAAGTIGRFCVIGSRLKEDALKELFQI